MAGRGRVRAPVCPWLTGWLLFSAGPAVASWIPPFSEPQTAYQATTYQWKGVSVALDAGGMAHLVLMDRAGPLATDLDRVQYVREGSAPEILATGTNLGNFADIAVGPGDTLHVVYRAVAGSNYIVASRRKPPGEPWLPQVTLRVGTTIVISPMIAFDGSGGRHLAWLEGGTRYMGPSGVVETVVPVTSPTAVDLAVNSGGNPHVVYTQLNVTLQKSYLLETVRHPATGWAVPDTVVDVPSSQYVFGPRIDFDAFGSRHLAWIQSLGAFGMLQCMTDGLGPAILSAATDTLGFYCGLAATPSGEIALVRSRTRTYASLTFEGTAAVTAERSLEFLIQCFPAHVRPEPYVIGPPCPCPPCSDPITCGQRYCPFTAIQFTDQVGNYIMIECLGAYYCTQYKRVGGNEVMISKCPWYGGRNSWLVYGTPSSTPNFPGPSRILGVFHRSNDFSCVSESPPYNYCDDYPQSPGRDWVEQLFYPCLGGKLQVKHYAAATGCLSNEARSQIYPGPGDPQWVQPPTACTPAGPPQGLHPPVASPPPTCPPSSPWAAANEVDSTMSGVASVVTFAGAPLGGGYLLRIGRHRVELPTRGGMDAAGLASALADSINASIVLGTIGIRALAAGPSTIVVGAPSEILSARSTDPGIVQPPAPAFLVTTIEDTTGAFFRRRARISWTNAGPYDELHVTKLDLPVALHLSGGETMAVDEDPWSLPQAYRVVAWKDGMPSDTAHVGPPVSVPAGGGSAVSLGTRAWPNPFTHGTTIMFNTTRAGLWHVEIFDPAGRAIRRWTGESGAGREEVRWDGLGPEGRTVPAGVYLYRVRHGGRTGTGYLVRIGR